MSHSLRRSTHRLAYLTALAAGLSALTLSSSSAIAANKAAKNSNRQAQENEARQACLVGDFAKGSVILSKLFVDTKDPTYIYNQGRCFEQNRQYDDAIARFREYLRVGRNKLDDGDKAEAEQHIADCKEMLAQEHGLAPAATASQPLVTPQPPTATTPAPPPNVQPDTIISKPERPITTSNGAGLRIGGIVTASVGVAAAAAGVLFNVKANSIAKDMANTYDGYSKDSDRKTYTTMAWIGYGVGAACVVTGAILYVVGLKAKSSSANDVALLPAVGMDQTGLQLMGAF